MKRRRTSTVLAATLIQGILLQSNTLSGAGSATNEHTREDERRPGDVLVDPWNGILTTMVSVPKRKSASGDLVGGGNRIIAYDFHALIPPYDTAYEELMLLDSSGGGGAEQSKKDGSSEEDTEGAESSTSGGGENTTADDIVDPAAEDSGDEVKGEVVRSEGAAESETVPEDVDDTVVSERVTEHEDGAGGDAAVAEVGQVLAQEYNSIDSDVTDTNPALHPTDNANIGNGNVSETEHVSESADRADDTSVTEKDISAQSGSNETVGEAILSAEGVDGLLDEGGVEATIEGEVRDGDQHESSEGGIENEYVKSDAASDTDSPLSSKDGNEGENSSEADEIMGDGEEESVSSKDKVTAPSVPSKDTVTTPLATGITDDIGEVTESSAGDTTFVDTDDIVEALSGGESQEPRDFTDIKGNGPSDTESDDGKVDGDAPPIDLQVERNESTRESGEEVSADESQTDLNGSITRGEPGVSGRYGEGPTLSDTSFEEPAMTEPANGASKRDGDGSKPSETPLEEPENNAARPSSSPSSTVNEEFVHGLDDIHKFMEEVEPPDELDVGAGGKSMQEVLMGQGTQILTKRVVKGVRHVRKSISRFGEKTRDRFEKVVNPTSKRPESSPGKEGRGESAVHALGGPFKFAVVAVEENSARVSKAAQALWKVCRRVLKRLMEVVRGEDDDGVEGGMGVNFDAEYGDGDKNLADLRRKMMEKGAERRRKLAQSTKADSTEKQGSDSISSLAGKGKSPEEMQELLKKMRLAKKQGNHVGGAGTGAFGSNRFDVPSTTRDVPEAK